MTAKIYQVTVEIDGVKKTFPAIDMNPDPSKDFCKLMEAKFDDRFRGCKLDNEGRVGDASYDQNGCSVSPSD